MADNNCNNSSVVKEVNNKTTAILESDANSNFLVDIIELSESQEEEVLLAFIRSVYKIFSTFCSRGKLHLSLQQRKAVKGSEDPGDVFNLWLHEKYLLTLRRLLHLLSVGSQNIKEFSLCTLMKFVAEEGKQKSSDGFPNKLFKQICDVFFNGKNSSKACIERFAEFLDYDDVRFFVLKNLAGRLGNVPVSEGEKEPYLVENVFTMLSQVKMKENDEDLNNFLIHDMKSAKGKDGSVSKQPRFTLVKYHKRFFSSAWIGFLAIPLTSEILKKILLNLHTDVLPHMTDPKLLMDFLTDSYNAGGVTSLLALNSLFFLIHKHNLDYPDFFKKLYALFEPNIFYVKYQARFFHLADLFLTSTHLPAYLIGAFVKRLSRLALTAPPHGAMLATAFVCNLIKRHPSVQALIHRKQSGKLLLDGESSEDFQDSCIGDPFIADEPDPAKCNALKSSLWELKTLQHHYYPGVSTLVEMLEKPLDSKETDISDYFDVSYDQLFQKECRKVTQKNSFLEFQVPKGIIGKGMVENWVLS
ncbi:nucleolar complex protein 4 homolog [Montipora foliosa]|uniref:nucleolar complex protein 4 homolog n=1 Tax=Montipora foliosa TaxID=591990 RepID=UPI0035F1A2F3